MLKIKLLLIGISISLCACHSTKEMTTSLNAKEKELLKTQIAVLGKQWSKGLKAQDDSIFRNLYDVNAHYLADNENAIHGNENITNHWKSFFGIIKDLELKLETLEGTKQLLYETGTGSVTVANQSGGADEFPFKYVNVWKLQTDGNYKVVIDIYNDVKAP